MLVVFDIDGTLTQTAGLDAEAYAASFLATFGAPLPETDWSRYRHATDSGVLQEAFAACFGRPVDAEAQRRFHDVFLTMLRQVLPATSARLQVPGAQQLLEALRARGHGVALATGCFLASARLKLERSALRVDGLVLAASDAEAERARIVRTALARAGGPERHGRCVYVGDGPWDVAAAQQLGLPFVGVDCAGDGRLRALGVARVLRDFSAVAETVDLLASS